MLTEYKRTSAKAFGLVGGIAFLTLIINGVTSGHLLHWLGLVTPTECRKKVVEHYKRRMVMYTLKEYVALLTEHAFQDVDFKVVKTHIPFLEDTTHEELMAAVKTHKEESSSYSYTPPNLKNVVPFLNEPSSISAEEDTIGQPEQLKIRRVSALAIRQIEERRQSVYDPVRTHSIGSLEEKIFEERVIFISVLRCAYYRLIKLGELEARGFIAHSLFQSLNLAEDAASRCLPLDDWNALQVSSRSWAMPAESMMRGLFNQKNVHFDQEFFVASFKVRQITAFTIAHEWAKKTFKREFSKCGDGELTEAEEAVLNESDEQVKLADAALSKLDATDVKLLTGRYACQILLNRAAYYIAELEEHGFMSGREAGELLDELHGHISDLFETHEMGRLRRRSFRYHITDMLNSIHQSVRSGASFRSRSSRQNTYEELSDCDSEE